MPSKTFSLTNIRARLSLRRDGSEAAGYSAPSKQDNTQYLQSLLRLGKDQYQYKALPSTRKFRLLRLDHSKDGNVQFDLRTFEIGKAPAYYGVSYCWGSATDRVFRKCNGRALGISNGLAEALDYVCRFQREQGVDWFWIDQICVNQNDVKERSQQVRVMREIYTGGWRTLIWLGFWDHETDAEALGLLNLIDGVRRRENWQPVTKDSPASITFEDMVMLGLPDRKSSAWTCLVRFMEKPWFERVWVIQEAALSRLDPVILLGDIVLSWHFLCINLRVMLDRDITVWLATEPSSFRNLSTTAKVLSGRNRPSGQPRFWSLEALLVGLQTRAVKAIDPRDQIYALLGLCSHFHDKALQPDYRASVQTVFAAATRYCLNVSGRLTVLGLSRTASVSSEPVYSDTSNISWIPYFGSPTSGSHSKRLMRPVYDEVKHDVMCSMDMNAFKTTRNTTVQLVSTDKETELSLRGGRMDSITFATETIAREDVRRYKTSPIRSIWEDMLSHSGLSELDAWSERFRHFGRAFYMCLCLGMKIDLQDASREPLGILWAYLAAHYQAQLPHHGMHQMYEEMGSDSKASELRCHSCDTRMFLTNNGRIGLGPSMIQVGDEVWALYGGATCHVLRNRGDGTHIFVGEAYVHGLMQGEALDMLAEGRLEESTVTLR